MITVYEQGFAYVAYTADGVEDNIPVPFPYLRQQDVYVALDSVPTTAFTWINASEIQLDAVPANGVIITVIRKTSQTARLVDFQDGGQLREATLDLDSNQMFYMAQEAIDSTSFALSIDLSTGTADAKDNRIINLADGIDPNDAVNKSQLDAVETIANNAAADATAAVATANAASATANGIAATANTALANSITAMNDAATALATANGIAATANTALSNSVTAMNDASTALSTANSAQADATQALADAAAAQSTANQGVSDAAAAQSDATTALANAAAAQADATLALSGIAAHLANPTGAHAASAISNIPSGNLAATDQQGVNNELQSDIDTRTAGPASSVDNTLPRFDGTSGKNLQASGIVVSDSDDIEEINSTLFKQISTPANPAATKNKMYFKSDDNLYIKNSAGIETQVSTVGSTKPLIIFNETLALNGSSSSVLGVAHFRIPVALIITQVVLQLFDKNGVVSGNLEIDLKTNSTPNNTGMSSIFTTKPILDFSTAADYDTNSGTLSSPNLTANHYIRLDVTQIPAGFVGYAQVLVCA